GPEAITFTLTVPPATGALHLAGAPLGAGARFTLADMMAGALTFAGTEPDTFSVTVSDAYNPGQPVFTIHVQAPEGEKRGMSVCAKPSMPPTLNPSPTRREGLNHPHAFPLPSLWGGGRGQGGGKKLEP